MTKFRDWLNENETAPKGWTDLASDGSDLNKELKKEKIKVIDLDIKTDKDGEFDGYNLDVEYEGKKITLTNKDLGDHPRVKDIIKKVKSSDVNENILAQIGSIGKMTGEWGKLGTWGTLMYNALEKDKEIQVLDLDVTMNKYDNAIDWVLKVKYKGKIKTIKKKQFRYESVNNVMKKIKG